mgnify:CR=1 FL=1
MLKSITKVFSVIIIISLSLNLNNCSSKKKRKKIYGFVTVDGLNLRNNVRGKIVAQLRAGEKITVLTRTEKKHVVNKMKDYWYQISTSRGKVGWVFAGYIELQGEKNRKKKLRLIKKGNYQDFNHYLYVANENSDTVGIYRIGTDGKLTFIKNQRALKKPVSVTAHPYLNYIYVLEFTRIITYKIKPNGTLEPIGTLKTGVGGKIIKAHPNGKYVYATSANPMINIGMYKVMSDGRLRGMGDVFTFKKPVNFDITPDGRNAYFYDRKKKNKILKFRIAISGKLKSKGETDISPGKFNGALQVSPDGEKLFVANVPDKSLIIFNINPDGDLKEAGKIEKVDYPGDLLFNDKGDRLYITHKNTGLISIYSSDKEKIYKKAGEIKQGKKPEDMVLHQSGNFLFVTNKTANKIYVYKITASGIEKIQEIAAGIKPESLCIGRIKKPGKPKSAAK